MTPEQRRDVARKGGIAAHKQGTAHEWTSDEARAAGRKGGTISRGGRGRAPKMHHTPTAESDAVLMGDGQ